MSEVGLILLAAGGSVRMGQPKQLLKADGVSLVRRAALTALASVCDPVAVVLGAYRDEIQPELEDLPVRIVRNADWEEGLGGSIRAGVTDLATAYPLLNAVLLTTCDQPFVSVEHLDRLVSEHRRTHAGIVASDYENAPGIPALFDSRLFAGLQSLRGDRGAKRLILDHPAETVTVPFPEGSRDLDTPEEFEEWSRSRPQTPPG